MSPDESRVNGTSPEQIEADIARQREELAATVSARLDVRTRARARAAELRDRATTPDGRPTPAVAVAAVALVALGALILWRRTR